MGIIEELVQKVDNLTAMVKALTLSSPTAPAAVNESQQEAPNPNAATDTTTVTPNSNAPITVDLALGFDKDGQPWDNRINSLTKNQTAKGVWKKTRGADKELIKTVLAENAGLQQSNTSEPSKSTPPTAAGKAPPTAAGKAPTASKQPQISAAEEDKKVLMAQMNRLTNGHKVEFDLVLEMLANFGAKTFDTLDPANYSKATTDYHAWADWLDMCQEEINLLVAHGEGTAESIVTILQNAGANSIADVVFANCSSFHAEIKAFRITWDNFKASQE